MKPSASSRPTPARRNVLYIHLTLVPFIATAGEVKTKPTQHSVKELRSIGIQPDILLCRTNQDLGEGIKKKIALFCNVSEDAVITAKDVKCIYEVPLNFHEEGLDDKIVEAAPYLDPGAPAGRLGKGGSASDPAHADGDHRHRGQIRGSDRVL